MIRLIPLMVSLLMLTLGAWAKPKTVTSPKKGKEKMAANLLHRCEDGIAVACYDYGKLLLSTRKAGDKRRGDIYIRRASTLAYAPACQMRPTATDSKPVKENKLCNGEELAKSARLSADGASVAEVGKGSLWEQSGIQVGDTVISVNGQPFSGVGQISDALDKGSAVLNVQRSGREQSVTINCP